MTPRNVLTKLSVSVLFILTVFLLTPAAGAAQSTNPLSPTVVASFPITGNLGSGTYYYQVPEALVSEGEARGTLTFTPPVGGGSMTASFSGPRCCSGEVTVGESTRLADTVRRSTTFSIPGRQNLLITINVSVAAKRTIRFVLYVSAPGAPSGIVITPPPPTPEPTPIPPSRGPCTDLSVDFYSVSGQTGLSPVITGLVRNLTTTHPYKGFERQQWLEVLDITDSETKPRMVARINIPAYLDPGGTFSYSAVHTLTERRRTRYQVQIVYAAGIPRNRSHYDDDCNTANNSTRRQVIYVPTDR